MVTVLLVLITICFMKQSLLFLIVRYLLIIEFHYWIAMMVIKYFGFPMTVIFFQVLELHFFENP